MSLLRLIIRQEPDADFDPAAPPDGTEVEELNCGSGGGDRSDTNLRILAVFIILIGSLLGALFPVLAQRTRWLSTRISPWVYETAKYFGSGVIIATSLIHLLAPALEALGSPCLSEAWGDYPYALAICMLSIFLIFIVELVAFRVGTARLAKLGLAHDAHGHGLPAQHASHGPEPDHNTDKSVDAEKAFDDDAKPALVGYPVATQIIGIAILEFGVVLHSILIGLTLAVAANDEFKILFVVLVFHQTFEGLGIGSRLAATRFPAKYAFVPIAGAVLYGITTPLGIAVGLGVRETYNPESTTASIVSGILDAFSSGILLYTGLVELMAHDFLFNREMIHASNGRLAYALGCMVLGAGLMALLGRWA